MWRSVDVNMSSLFFIFGCMNNRPLKAHDQTHAVRLITTFRVLSLVNRAIHRELLELIYCDSAQMTSRVGDWGGMCVCPGQCRCCVGKRNGR